MFQVILICRIFDRILRSLRNARTKIHKNLFVAMIIQVIIRLTLYIDQALIRNRHDLANDNMSGIQNTVSKQSITLQWVRTEF